MPDSNYAYISGKIRALEPMVLDETDIERMVDAPDFDSAFKVLNDTDYANNLLDIDPLNYRDALRNDFKGLHKLLSKVPDKLLTKILYLERDFLNIKYLFKAKYFGLTLEDRVVTEVNYKYEDLEQFIMEGKGSGLDEQMQSLLKTADKHFSQAAKDPSAFDSYLTGQYFQMMLNLGKELNNSLVLGWVRKQINNLNVLTFLRGKRLGLAAERISKKFITGGEINEKDLVKYYLGDGGDIKSLISKHYDLKVKESYANYLESGILFQFEKALEDYLTRFVRSAKYVTFGPEVIVGYFISKTIAVKNVRLIMTGKLNGVSAEAIKNTLREVY